MNRCLNITTSILVLVMMSWPISSFADVPPPIASGNEFVTHQVSVTNMSDFPDYALLVYDAGTSLQGHLTFDTDRPAKQTLIQGRNWRSRVRFRAPQVWLIKRSDEATWSDMIKKSIKRQRSDCEQGKGCAHISRFMPTYPPPEKVIDCGLQITVIAERKKKPGVSTKVTDIFEVVEASPNRCLVKKISDARTIGIYSTNNARRFIWLLMILCGVGVFFAVQRFNRSQLSKLKAVNPSLSS